MPDLGKYAEPVLWSYAISVGMIVALVGLSVMRSRRVKAQLDAVETRRSTDG